MTASFASRALSPLVGTTTTAYGINGGGQRISKTGAAVTNGGTNEYVYDEQSNLLGEYGSIGTIIQETGYLPNTPVSVLSRGFGIAGFGVASPTAVYTGAAGATVASLTPDWLGAPHIITNSSKTYLWRWDHYDFGNNAPNQNPAGAGTYPYNLRLPGQYADAESGLFYNGFRDYNSTLGRYIQSDPIGLAGGVSTYGYVGANPMRSVDPFGLDNVNWYPEIVVPWLTDPFYQSPANIYFSHIYYNINNPGHVFSIAAHGSSSFLYNPNGEVTTPEDLASLLSSGYKGYKSGETVLLDSCNTGQGGGNSFAAKLAKLINAPVVAPNDFIWSHWGDGGPQPNPNFDPPTVGPSLHNNSGQWIQFNPNGTSAPVSYPSQGQ